MEPISRVRILDEAIRVNALGKFMNPSSLNNGLIVFTQPLYQEQDVTQGQFLSEVELL